MISKWSNRRWVWRVSSQAMTSTSRNSRMPRIVISSRLPIGVAIKYKTPDTSLTILEETSEELTHLNAGLDTVPIVPCYSWQPPEKPIAIQLQFDVVDRMILEVMKGFGAVPRRGAEVGGFLLGTRGQMGDQLVVEVRDFAPVGFIGATAYLLAVHPSLPVKSVAELIAVAKARPGQLNYASGGLGSTLHLSAELFRSMTGVQFTHLPYKGGVPAVSAVIAGEAQLLFGSITTIVPAAKANRVRPLAVTGAKRSAVTPELPTLAESGLVGFEVKSWLRILQLVRLDGARAYGACDH